VPFFKHSVYAVAQDVTIISFYTTSNLNSTV